MKSYKVILAGKEYEILQDKDGKFIKPDFVKQLESYGTDVKPAHEPICVARKPLESTVANNVLKHGTGGLNIDGTRVETDEVLNYGTGKKSNVGFKTSPQNNDRPVYDGSGRFPANLIHDGSDEVEAVFPQTGKSQVRKVKPTETLTKENTVFETSGYKTRLEGGVNDNGGSASRFFYCAKAKKSERNAGLEGFEEHEQVTYNQRPSGGLNAHLHGQDSKPQSNYHPTVKPLSLTKYLATLIKPPTECRLLVPFSGSGSEMIGALQAGWDYVEGVELTEEYIPIAEARIEYWLEQMQKQASKPKQEALL